jgi:hypothetical protein
MNQLVCDHPAQLRPRFRTAVSLHGHTLHSRESLDFILRLANSIGILRFVLERGSARYRTLHGTELDLSRAWWTPPITPYDAWRLEAGRIQQQLGMAALVSLTDHDDIQAPIALRVLGECARVPVSVEWTVPFQNTFFHLGVHNLPPDSARSIMGELAAFTQCPNESRLGDLLHGLSTHRSVLIVFNHPCWDEKGIGRECHMATARTFAQRFGETLNAFELNGMRPWSENTRAMALAKDIDKPIISGGDRHALEPSTLLNVTNAVTFEEFIEEVRDGHSQVLVKPEYTEPFAVRILHDLTQILADHESHGLGWKRWSDRAFYSCDDGVVRPLSALWGKREPAVLRIFIRGVQMLRQPALLGVFRTVMGSRREAAL